MFSKESKCALIGAPCPKTGDESAPVYCPNWVNNVPEVEKDGTGRVTAEVFYTGCQLRRSVLYQLSITASAAHAAASADKAANETISIRQDLVQLGQGLRQLETVLAIGIASGFNEEPLSLPGPDVLTLPGASGR